MSKSVSNPFILKGLDKSKISLITEKVKGKLVVTKVHAFVNPKLLKMSEFQPRIEYDLEGIIKSIEEEGIKEEIQVNEHSNGDLIIIDGGRRTLASIELKKKEVPIIVKRMTIQEEQDAVLISNIVKKSFTPIELARALRFYKKKWDSTNVELGHKFFPHLSQEDTSSEGKASITSASQNVGRYLKLLELPEGVQALLIEDGYSVEKAYRLTLLKLDRTDEPPEWKERRVKLQLELARSNISLKDLKGRISILIKQEKEIRESVKREVNMKESLIKEYNKELKSAVSQFVEYTTIDFSIPDNFNNFKINDLKQEKEHWEKEINKGRINEKEIEYREKAIELLKDLIRLMPNVEELQEIDNDHFNQIFQKLASKDKQQKKESEEIDRKLFILNSRWSDIQIVMRKIQQFLYTESQKGAIGIESSLSAFKGA